MAREHEKRSGKQGLLRGLFLLLLMLPLLFPGDVLSHFQAHFTGGIIQTSIRLQWHIVVLNILVFLSFLVPLSFRRRVDWKEYGLVSAFFVSLFVEMYGVPFLMLFLSGYLGTSEAGMPESAVSFRLLGVDFGMTLTMIYGLLLMLVGSVLIILGWVTLYRQLGREEESLVTRGIYAYSRHPQYFGFILVILGWLMGWPTVLTVILAPILIYKYLRVCGVEEKELSGDICYQGYRKEVPFFV